MNTTTATKNSTAVQNDRTPSHSARLSEGTCTKRDLSKRGSVLLRPSFLAGDDGVRVRPALLSPSLPKPISFFSSEGPSALGVLSPRAPASRGPFQSHVIQALNFNSTETFQLPLRSRATRRKSCGAVKSRIGVGLLHAYIHTCGFPDEERRDVSLPTFDQRFFFYGPPIDGRGDYSRSSCHAACRRERYVGSQSDLEDRGRFAHRVKVMSST